ncbi:NACHT C-terminal helical domain 2-containing protein [Halotia branconii]|uniref:NACHT conflict system C-terminal helical domain-containing protein n=1 Tax=Halotia branconii CENA392 TaxID=1539056 RepID=A0AAJ6P8E3_9CYAN|nr:hypothetical protein [Halotia branconii]WGV24600.1 hypothetical protein QI031_22935 [Halotia branconii CENA392]
MTGEFLCFSASGYEFSTEKLIYLINAIDSNFKFKKIEKFQDNLSEIEIDYHLIRSFEIASELEEWCTFGIIEDSDLLELYSLDYELDKTLYFQIPLNSRANYELISFVQKLKNQLPPNNNEDSQQIIDWWKNHGSEWLKEFKDWLIEHRKVTHYGWFLDINLEVLHRYYNFIKLILDCLNNSKVSPKFRSLIEDNLFLPLD